MARGPEHRPKVPVLGLSEVGAARQRSGKHTAAENTAWAAAEAGTGQGHLRGVSPGRGWRKSQVGGPRPAGLVRALCGVEGTAGKLVRSGVQSKGEMGVVGPAPQQLQQATGGFGYILEVEWSGLARGLHGTEAKSRIWKTHRFCPEYLAHPRGWGGTAIRPDEKIQIRTS